MPVKRKESYYPGKFPDCHKIKQLLPRTICHKTSPNSFLPLCICKAPFCKIRKSHQSFLLRLMWTFNTEIKYHKIRCVACENWTRAPPRDRCKCLGCTSSGATNRWQDLWQVLPWPPGPSGSASATEGDSGSPAGLKGLSWESDETRTVKTLWNIQQCMKIKEVTFLNERKQNEKL